MAISKTSLILNPDGSIYHLNLKPEHVTDTIITVGDPSRVYSVSKHFDSLEFEMNKREFITHVGKYKGKRVMVISTGIGTDNIEIFFTEIDALVNIDLKKREAKSRKKKLRIIRVGTSGALQEDIPINSMLYSTSAVGLDNLMMFYQWKMNKKYQKIADALQEKVGFPSTPYIVNCSKELESVFQGLMPRGNAVTTPGFYAPQGRAIRLELKYPDLLDKLTYFHEDDFWLTNFEMETAGYYAMASLLGHEMISLNAIIANRQIEQFSKSPNIIVDKLIKIALDNAL